MYELITGNLPFKGDNAVEIALKHMKDKLPSITKDNPNVPQSVENIILKACAKNPKNRYNDAREMYVDLQDALKDEKKDEARLVYKYPEEELEETKKIPKIDDVIDKPAIIPVDNEEKPKSKIIFILISLVTFLLLLLLVFFLILPKYTKVPDIKVPDVANETVQDAESILIEAGFEVAVETVQTYSETVEEGLVIKTSPAKGRIIKEGTVITIYESLGTEKIVIEDYTGDNIYEVKAMLQLLGLRVDIDSKNVDDVTAYKDKEDEIIDQEPKEGELSQGDQVILYYPNIVVYPDMTGWTIDDVNDFVDQYELNLTVVEEETDSYTTGTVIDQSRKEGILVVRKANLTVTLAVPIKIEEPVEEEVVE